MTAKQLENKIKDLQYWVESNLNHPDHQQNVNLLLHYQFQYNKLKNLNT